MPITTEHVGRRYASQTPYQVCRAKIVEFLSALGVPAPTGDAEVIAPPTFAIVVLQDVWARFFADPELEIALHRTMHADQKFEYVRPLRDGDLLSTELHIDRVRVRGNIDMVTIVVRITDDAGELVCTATSQILHTRPDSTDAEVA